MNMRGRTTPGSRTSGAGGGFDAHLISIYLAAARPSGKTLIYINAPGDLSNFMDSKTTLIASVVLERIRVEYPEAAEEANTYLRYLYGSVGYRKALAELGPDWKRRVDPETLEFVAKDSPPPTPPAAPVKGASFTQRAFRLYDWSFDRLSHVPMIREPRPRLSRTFDKNERVIQLLDECASRYLDPANDKWVRRMTKKEDFWVCSGGDEVFRAWAGIVAKICRARGVRFVYYIPPHMHVTPTEYREAFKPEYVDRVKQTFAPYAGVTVIDRTMAPGFNVADLTWWTHFHGVDIKAGYLYNAIGTLKAARILVASLAEAGVLDHEGRSFHYLGSAWPGEARLPQGPSTIRYVPQDKTDLVHELILEPEYRIRSRQVADLDRSDK